jgi:polyribonucleotide nucleotidyltransferase
MENSKIEEERQFSNITQSLPIPEYKIGFIIGKNGTYINQLSKKSGARITISDSKSKEYGTVWKYVQITGSGRAVDRAKKLLHIRLERIEPREVIENEGRLGSETEELSKPAEVENQVEV